MSAPKQRRLTAFFERKNKEKLINEASSLTETNTAETSGNCNVNRSECEPMESADSGEKLRKKVSVKREFRTEWLKQNYWLQYEKDEMTCSICMSEGKDNPFTHGCKNFRHSTILRHIESKQHKSALEAQSLRSNLAKQTSSLMSTKNEAVTSALRSVYWLAKEQLPTSKHKSLFNLQRLQGCNFPDELQVGSTTYTSHTAAEDMQDAIASVLREKTDASLNSSPFISILLDESCDISVTKKLLLYARTVSPTFDVDTHFISNVSIPDCTAKTIYQSVKETLSSRGVPLDHVLVVGSDGASVMTGSKNGLVALIKKNDSPFVFGVHCSAHRLALCSSQAADKVPYLKKYQQFLSDIFYHFKRSALRREKLREIQTILDDPKIQYKELHSVRWFSMYAALEAIYRTWPSLATYMESQVQSTNDSVAKGFMKKITTFVFIAITYLLMDIIPKITQLSLFFQKENIDIAMVRPSVDSVVQQLEWLKTNDGSFLTEFLSVAGDKIEIFKGVKVHDSEVYRLQFTKTRQLFLNNLISEVTRRFPAVSTDVISNMSVLSLRGLSLMSSDDRQEYGVPQITSLVEYYGHGDEPFMNPEETLVEWSQCKDLVVQQKYPCHTVSSTWKLLSTNHPESFPNLMKLSRVAVIAPLQTATVERGFSVQNDIKVSSRNRLSGGRLDVLMQISLGPAIEVFDFESALKMWKQNKLRKLYSKKQ